MDVGELNVLSGIAVDAAMQVHTALGPGLLESAYERCLLYELRSRGLFVQNQLPMPIAYRGIRIETAYRIDLLVNRELIIELKVVSRILPIHEAQLLSYLRASDRRLGLLINFYVTRLKHGIRRIVNGLDRL